MNHFSQAQWTQRDVWALPFEWKNHLETETYKCSTGNKAIYSYQQQYRKTNSSILDILSPIKAFFFLF
jgi:hypothetical protein